MTPEQIEAERPIFEAWVTKELYRPVRDREGNYQDDAVEDMWEAWQARAALDRLPPLVEVPDVPMQDRPPSEWPVVSLDGEKLDAERLPEESE